MTTPVSGSANYVVIMEREFATHSARSITEYFELYKEYKNWLWAQYINSDLETKKIFREDKGFLYMLDLYPEDVVGWEHGSDEDEEDGDEDEYDDDECDLDDPDCEDDDYRLLRIDGLHKIFSH